MKLKVAFFALLLSVFVSPLIWAEGKIRKVKAEILTPGIYTADPSAHVFEGKLYVYPSHDWDADLVEDDQGSMYDMKDYHVYSFNNINEPITDHGKVLDKKDIPWVGRQLWAPDAAEKDGKYYLYFPAKDKQDIFRIGVATSNKPEGPFTPLPEPMANAYSIDPAVFKDDDGSYYMYVGGIWGGQLQWWPEGKFSGKKDMYPADDAPALLPRVAKLADDMVSLAEKLKPVQIIDKNGSPILTKDNQRRFFEAAWIHKFKGKYYLSWSTGDTHQIVYGIGNNPYGPFVYQGVILEEVKGWTNHHSIVNYQNTWYLFFHDTSASGKNHLRSIKMTELYHNSDGTIQRMNAMVD